MKLRFLNVKESSDDEDVGPIQHDDDSPKSRRRSPTPKVIMRKRVQQDKPYSEDQHVGHLQHDDGHLRSRKRSPIPEGIVECQLALTDPHYRMVATGLVHNTNTGVAHTQPLPSNLTRVEIKYAIERNTPLPIPNEDDDAFTVHDALGTLVLWPVDLIIPAKPQQEFNNREVEDAGSHTPSKNKYAKGSYSKEKPPKNDSFHASSKLQPKKLDFSHETRVPHVDSLPPDLQMFYKFTMRMSNAEQTEVHVDIGIPSEEKRIYLG